MAKKTIFTANFVRAQKTLDISKAKALLKESLLHVHENADQFPASGGQQIEHTMTLLTDARKLREKEAAIFYTESEEQYALKKFEFAGNLLKFAENLVEQSGLHNWTPKINTLKRKIIRSQDVLEKIRKYHSPGPMDLPIIELQQNREAIGQELQEMQAEADRQDAVHPDLVAEFQKLADDYDQFFDEHGIAPLDATAGRASGVWGSAKAALDIKAKEMKLKKALQTAQNAPTESEAEEGFLRAYKLIQENPAYFSTRQKQEIIEQISHIGKVYSMDEDEFRAFLDEMEGRAENLAFSEAVEAVLAFQTSNEARLSVSQDQTLTEIARRLRSNADIGAKLQKTKKKLDAGDIIGAKSELIRFLSFFEQVRLKVDIYPPLEAWIGEIKETLASAAPQELAAVAGPLEFDPIGESSIEPGENDQFISLFVKFEYLLDSRGKLTRDDLAEALNLSPDELFTLLLEWKKKSDFKMVGPEIHSAYFQKQTQPEGGTDTDQRQNGESAQDDAPQQKSTKKSGGDKADGQEDDLLDTLDDLLNTDF